MTEQNDPARVDAPGVGSDGVGTHGDRPGDGESNALISRLRVIESQPLADRAAAFSQIYDTLQSVLGGGGGTAPAQ